MTNEKKLPNLDFSGEKRDSVDISLTNAEYFGKLEASTKEKLQRIGTELTRERLEAIGAALFAKRIFPPSENPAF